MSSYRVHEHGKSIVKDAYRTSVENTARSRRAASTTRHLWFHNAMRSVRLYRCNEYR